MYFRKFHAAMIKSRNQSMLRSEWPQLLTTAVSRHNEFTPLFVQALECLHHMLGFMGADCVGLLSLATTQRSAAVSLLLNPVTTRSNLPGLELFISTISTGGANHHNACISLSRNQGHTFYHFAAAKPGEAIHNNRRCHSQWKECISQWKAGNVARPPGTANRHQWSS
jgi:hypothetical protein